MPNDANWVVDPATGRNVCLRANGNKIEKTVYGHAMIDGAPATFVFRSTAYAIGRSQANLSHHVKVTIDDEDIRVIDQSHVTSRPESNNFGRWFVPQIDLIGKFGSPKGPTLAEVRVAKALRIALKTGSEPAAIDAPKTPQLTSSAACWQRRAGAHLGESAVVWSRLLRRRRPIATTVRTTSWRSIDLDF